MYFKIPSQILPQMKGFGKLYMEIFFEIFFRGGTHAEKLNFLLRFQIIFKVSVFQILVPIFGSN